MDIKITQSEAYKIWSNVRDNEFHNIIQYYTEDDWNNLYYIFSFNNRRIPFAIKDLNIHMDIDANKLLGEDDNIPYAVISINQEKLLIVTSFDVYSFSNLNSSMKEVRNGIKMGQLSYEEGLKRKIEARRDSFMFNESIFLRKYNHSIIDGLDNEVNDCYNLELLEHIDREVRLQRKFKIQPLSQDPKLTIVKN